MMVGQVNGMNLSGQRAQSMLVQGDKQNGGMQKGFCILTLLQLMSIFLFGMKILAWNTSTGRSLQKRNLAGAVIHMCLHVLRTRLRSLGAIMGLSILLNLLGSSQQLTRPQLT
ncbi:uncharacterized protein LOC116123929 isoform X1 [Pistacia vera]|uniref:uncharacterized protein LOC116123929 isoform X1 n=1 Tax=Pistacia vera TaxID=55513 RepID=UPI0012635118|nr:uncharacterized protein LOC116123929 isoform X1 [Pistacia vera]XP_031265529.1 uncharacterized protein LOC116123929 isoform X1 [Pistacia vera]